MHEHRRLVWGPDGPGPNPEFRQYRPIQLATEQVVLLELHGEPLMDVATEGTRVLDPTGAFTANSGPDLSAQTAYHLIQSWYDYTDEHLTDPATGTKQWDSANWLYTEGMWPGDTPPGTYSVHLAGRGLVDRLPLEAGRASRGGGGEGF